MRGRQLAFGLLFVGGSLLFGGMALYSSIRAANRARGLSKTSVAVLERARLGEAVLVEGHVSDRNPVLLESTGFVAYSREWREVTYDDEGRPDPGSWSVVEHVTPPLLLELPDGLLRVENDDYDIEDAQVVDEREPGESADELDTRLKGIRSGDPVIAVGVASAGVERPQIRADFIARGTRADYIARRRSGGAIFFAFSIVVAALGAAILFWDHVRRLFSRGRTTAAKVETSPRSQEGDQFNEEETT